MLVSSGLFRVGPDSDPSVTGFAVTNVEPVECEIETPAFLFLAFRTKRRTRRHTGTSNSGVDVES